MRTLSFSLAVLLGASLFFNITLAQELESNKITQEFLYSHINQLNVDNNVLTQGLAWWKYRTQVVALERDNARRALELQWTPTTIVKANLK